MTTATVRLANRARHPVCEPSRPINLWRPRRTARQRSHHAAAVDRGATRELPSPARRLLDIGGGNDAQLRPGVGRTGRWRRSL